MKLWKPKTLVAQLTAGLTLISLSLGIVVAILQFLPEPEAATSGFVFVVDVSPGMFKPLGANGGTRLDAAEHAIAAVISTAPGAPSALHLVRRRDCEVEARQPALELADHDREQYSDVFAKLRQEGPGGHQQSSFVGGLAAAASGLSNTKRIEQGGQKIVFFFVADPDSGCDFNVNLSHIGRDIPAQFYVFGAGPRGLRKARTLLGGLGFSVAEGGRVRDHDDLDKVVVVIKRVIRDPATTSTIENGTTASTETETDPTVAVVPSVVGMGQQDAENQIQQNDLEPQVVEVDVENLVEVGRVVAQEPAADTEVGKGSAVTIEVGKQVGS